MEAEDYRRWGIIIQTKDKQDVASSTFLKQDSCFSYFVFKIRLIRLGFSFKNKKILYLNSQPTDSQSGVITTTPQSQL